MRLGRRTFVCGSAVTVLVTPAVARADSPDDRKATFEEIGDRVVVSLSLPGLFRWYDQEALEAVDSNLDNTLQFTLTVREYKSRRAITEQTLLRKIRRDPWKKQYVVSTREDKGWSKRYFETRDEAIEFAVALSRVTIAQSEELERSENGPYYYVEVLALRNPIKGGRRRSRGGGSHRSRGRDLEWFGRLVDVLVGERAVAEEVVHVRTNPFYLVQR